MHKYSQRHLHPRRRASNRFWHVITSVYLIRHSAAAFQLPPAAAAAAAGRLGRTEGESLHTIRNFPFPWSLINGKILRSTWATEVIKFRAFTGSVALNAASAAAPEGHEPSQETQGEVKD